MFHLLASRNVAGATKKKKSPWALNGSITYLNLSHSKKKNNRVSRHRLDFFFSPRNFTVYTQWRQYKGHCVATGACRRGSLLGGRVRRRLFTCRSKRSSAAPLDASYGNKCQVSVECNRVTQRNASSGVPLPILCKCLGVIVLSGCLSVAQARLVRSA